MFGLSGAIAASIKRMASVWYSWTGGRDVNYSSSTTYTAVSYANIAMLTDTYGIMVNTNQSVIKVQSITRSGTSITFGSEFTVEASGYAAPYIYRLNSTQAVLVYRPNAAPYGATARIITAGGSPELSIGSGSAVNDGGTCWLRALTRMSDSTFVIAYEDTSSGQVAALRGASVSGSTITWGTEVKPDAAAGYQMGLDSISSSAGVWTRQNTSTSFTVRYFTMSGTTVSMGTEYGTGLNDDAVWAQVKLNTTGTIGATCYTKDTTTPGFVYCTPFSISGSTITLGSNTAITSVTSQWTGDVAYMGTYGGFDYFSTIFRDKTDTTLAKVKIFKINSSTRAVDTAGPVITINDSTAAQADTMALVKSGPYLLAVFADNGTKKIRVLVP